MIKVKKINTDILFSSLLSLLILFRDVFAISISKYVFAVIIIVFFAYARKNEISQMFCFLFPLLWGLPYTWFALKEKEYRKKRSYLF